MRRALRRWELARQRRTGHVEDAAWRSGSAARWRHWTRSRREPAVRWWTTRRPRLRRIARGPPAGFRALGSHRGYGDRDRVLSVGGLLQGVVRPYRRNDRGRSWAGGREPAPARWERKWERGPLLPARSCFVPLTHARQISLGPLRFLQEDSAGERLSARLPQTWADTGFVAGGQGVAGSNPAVPTIFRTLWGPIGIQARTIMAGAHGRERVVRSSHPGLAISIAARQAT